MTFYSYAVRKYLKSVSLQGNLARSIKKNKENFPRNGTGKWSGWYHVLYNYLAGNGASTDTLHVFEAMWKEYIACEKRRLH